MSLNLRVFLAASAILSSFFGLAGVALDQLYNRNTRQALEERLQGSIYQLIAVATPVKDGHIIMPTEVPDARLNNIHSGMYALIVSNKGNWQWKSASMADLKFQMPLRLPRTVHKSAKIKGPDSNEYMSFSYGVVWGDSSDPEQAYTFTILQNLTDYNADIAAFRSSLWGTLGGVAVLLLLVQGAILRWGLSPLKHAAEELSAIEEGTKTRLEGEFPPELKALTRNINALLSHQEEHLERYRKSLGDLAHSLKTPLAILQAAVDNKIENNQLAEVVGEQVDRMNQITGHQLHRAATSGRMVLRAPIKVDKTVIKVLNGLQKVYAEKNVKVTTKMSEPIEFHGDEGDLMEIIGNLADNAFKWCAHNVSIKIGNTGQQSTLLVIEDDGPGIPPDLADFVMQRGSRVSQDIAGHGIGLSIVSDIIQIYGGDLEISKSQLGGVKAHVSLPIVSKG